MSGLFCLSYRAICNLLFCFLLPGSLHCLVFWSELNTWSVDMYCMPLAVTDPYNPLACYGSQDLWKFVSLVFLFVSLWTLLDLPSLTPIHFKLGGVIRPKKNLIGNPVNLAILDHLGIGCTCRCTTEHPPISLDDSSAHTQRFHLVSVTWFSSSHDIRIQCRTHCIRLLKRYSARYRISLLLGCSPSLT